MSDPTARKSGREALRGAEVQTIDLIFKVLPADQWAKLLRAPLERTAAKGQRELAQRLMRAGAEIGDALHKAVRRGQEIIARDLLAGGAPIAAKNKSGCTPLHTAAERGKTKIVQLLLLKAADVDAFNNQEFTPLCSAARLGHLATVQALLAAGADVSFRCGRLKGQAIHMAACEGHVEIVKAVIKHGADVDAFDIHERTPLYIAACRGQLATVQALLAAGADVSFPCGELKGQAIHTAAGEGYVEIVKAVIKHGENVDALDIIQEQTPLFQAAYWGQLATVQALLAAGADVSFRCGELKGQAIHVAAGEGYVEIVRTVIEHGADVDAVNARQSTALHCAAYDSKADIIDVLVAAGANIEARNRDGYTPLHRASHNLNREAVLSFLKHGAAVNAQDGGLKTPLVHAAAKAGTQGAADVVDALLRAGADETIVDDQGSTAADVIGVEVEEEERLAEDVERARELLANAPADRAWRRRGYLVLCRAHPDRMQQGQVISGIPHTDTGRRTRSRAKLARARGSAGCSTVNGSTGGDWTVVVATVMQQLPEEGIFRTIVGFL